MIQIHKDYVVLGKRYHYLFTDNIGEGSFAKVYKGLDLETQKVVAIKVCAKQKMDEEEEIALQKQIHIMRQLNHPNIVSFYDVFKDKKYTYIVLQYLEGGELYDHILEKQTYSENQAKMTILPILDAVRYLHEVNIIHRDIKPENIVYTYKDGVQTVKIIDFGVSQIISNETVMSTTIGTPLYMAPQIFEGEKYRGAVDIWSLGVVLYVLFCGYPPFQSEGVELQNQIKTGEIAFEEEDWVDVSESATDLVKRMLEKNPDQRITMSQIYKHPWIQEEAPKKKLTQTKKKLQRAVKKLRIALKMMNVLKAKKASKQS